MQQIFLISGDTIWIMSDKNEYLLNSELNQIIPAEIKHDEFYTWIQKISREEKIQTVLEIGQGKRMKRYNIWQKNR